MTGHDYRTEVTLAAGSRRARVALAASRPVEIGQEVSLVDCDLPTTTWTVVGVHGVRSLETDADVMWYSDDRAPLGPETMAWFEIWKRGGIEDRVGFASSLRLRRDASEPRARDLLASALAEAAVVPDGALIGPSRWHRGERLVAWVDLGGFTRVRGGPSLAPIEVTDYGLRWTVQAAVELLPATRATIAPG